MSDTPKETVIPVITEVRVTPQGRGNLPKVRLTFPQWGMLLVALKTLIEVRTNYKGGQMSKIFKFFRTLVFMFCIFLMLLVTMAILNSIAIWNLYN